MVLVVPVVLVLSVLPGLLEPGLLVLPVLVLLLLVLLLVLVLVLVLLLLVLLLARPRCIRLRRFAILDLIKPKRPDCVLPFVGLGLEAGVNGGDVGAKVICGRAARVVGDAVGVEDTAGPV